MIQPGTQWPPPELAKVIERTQESQVWWEGDPDKLDEYYSVSHSGGRTRPSNGGVVNRVREWFWGKPPSPSQTSKKLHAPIPADIAKLSASELFAEPVKFLDPNGAAQKRADKLLNTPTFHGNLFTGAESCSALGGNYQRVVWDDTVADHAWIDFVDCDRAIPTFVWGRLTAVTFWSELPDSDDREVWRHLQRYEKGRIVHALYKGTPNNLGSAQPLEARDETSGITLDGFDDKVGGFVVLGVDELAASYVPNVLPNPEWRSDPQLRHLGLADIRHDLVPTFHSLDQILTSLPREFRVAQARMYASETVLQNLGAGNGMQLSDEQEIFTPVGNAMGKDGDLESLFQFHQPAIRVLEHDQGGEILLRHVLRTTGYSPVSMGMSDEVAQTATEARGKKELTVTTTEGKARYWTAALAPLATTLLRVDAVKFPGKGVAPVEELELDWPEFASESDEARSRTVQGWETAKAASTKTKVQYLHQDWDEERVAEEVELIDKANAVPSPFSDPFGSDGGDNPDPRDDAESDDEPQETEGE